MTNKSCASNSMRKLSAAKKAKKDFFLSADKRLPNILLAKNPLRIGKSFASEKKKSDAIIKQQFETISSTFKIKKDKYELFKQAVSGSGSEWKEINQLNSSTLLAFLCFQSISKDTPLHIVLGNRGVDFTAVSFEQKNYLPKSISDRFKKSHPASNMDIVLTDADNEFELNLESKFTEYFTSQTKFSVASYYGEQYDFLFKDQYTSSRIKYCHDGKPDYNNCRWETLDDGGHYIEGIKQMVSHYLGLRQRKSNDEFKHRRIYLGEILFDFNDKRSHSQEDDEFTDYKKCHHELYKILSHFSEITYIGKLLTYQKIFSLPGNSCLLTPAVKSFYKLGH